MSRSCFDCPTILGPNNKSGLCRLHFNRSIARDPAVSARKSASLKRYAADPSNKATLRSRSKRAAATRLADPQHAAWASQFMRQVVQPKSVTPEELVKGHRREAQRKSVEARMAWCPAEYLDTYRTLIRAGIKKAEAMPMVLELAAGKKARNQSSFDEQLARVAAGAPIASKVNLTRAEHNFTLGGVSAGIGL